MCFQWGREQEAAFIEVKILIQSAGVLTHYDPKKEMVITCDASPKGVGAVLYHVMPDGSDHPIVMASRSLSPAEKNYSQIDKEALGLIFAVKKFHQYISGQHFVLFTDHKPLLGLFGENKSLPERASPRILRWAIMLQAYTYTLKHKKGKDNGHADGLSMLPLPHIPRATPTPGDNVNLMETIDKGPVNAQQIKEGTSRDPVLAKVRHYILSGWPSEGTPEIISFYNRKDKLSVEDGCILWGCRVVVPPNRRGQIMAELHDTHPGITLMKGVARSLVWWPSIDTDLEKMVKSCSLCQGSRNNPTKTDLHPWEYPNNPWSRLHVDYAGPLFGRMYLIVVDAYSKWVEIAVARTATSEATIEGLREMFATHGVPDTLVSDNGSFFTSEQFSNFCNRNNITHITSAPFHPASNGLAERAVQTFKAKLKRMQTGSLTTKISRILLRQHTTPHSTTGVPPCQILMGRMIKTPMAAVFPSVQAKVQAKQGAMKKAFDLKVAPRDFELEEVVYSRNYGQGSKHLPGNVDKQGSVTYGVLLKDKRYVRRHADQLFSRLKDNRVTDVVEGTSQLPPVVAVENCTPEVATETEHEPDKDSTQVPISPSNGQSRALSVGDTTVIPGAVDMLPLRRSSREIKPPRRLIEEV